MIKAKRLEELELPGLGEDRKPVFPSGVAILAEVMSTLRIEQLEISSGARGSALRHAGSTASRGHAGRAIRAMQKRYHVDVDQAERVEATAAALFEDVQRAWRAR